MAYGRTFYWLTQSSHSVLDWTIVAAAAAAAAAAASALPSECNLHASTISLHVDVRLRGDIKGRARKPSQRQACEEDALDNNTPAS